MHDGSRGGPRRRLRRSLVPVAIAIFALSGLSAGRAAGSTSHEQAVLAGTLRLINAARTDLGLRALHLDSRLNGLAGKRARFMSDSGRLSHDSYLGGIGPAMKSTGLSWLLAGEAVGRMSHAATADVAPLLFELWRRSPTHWELIVSRDFNYLGIGVSVAPAGTTYVALVFAETADRTPPVAAEPSGAVSGRTVRWDWSATDVALQTHTAGVCTYDVAYRDNDGPWRQVRERTSARSLALAARTAGHVYALRVRARDCAGNLSGWSAPRAIRVT